MTVHTPDNQRIYLGNGATVAFPTGFRVLAAGDIDVELLPDGAEEYVLQFPDTDYLLTGVGDENGATVTMMEAPIDGDRLRIWRILPLVQAADLSGSAYSPAQYEDALDYRTMVAQQLDADVAAIEATIAAYEAGGGTYTHFGWDPPVLFDVSIATGPVVADAFPLTVDLPQATGGGEIAFSNGVEWVAGTTPSGVIVVRARNDTNPDAIFDEAVVPTFDDGDPTPGAESFDITNVTGLAPSTNYTLTLLLTNY